MPPEIRAIVGLGSNLGNSQDTLHNAWIQLGRDRQITPAALSHPYRSAPVGMKSKNWFVNAVGVLQTTLAPEQLLKRLLGVEKEFGRIRSSVAPGYQDRSLDLDLLFYGDSIISSNELTVPHPASSQRLFVLAPLFELLPDFVDPHSGAAVSRLYRTLLDQLAMEKNASQEISKIEWLAGQDE